MISLLCVRVIDERMNEKFSIPIHVTGHVKNTIKNHIKNVKFKGMLTVHHQSIAFFFTVVCFNTVFVYLGVIVTVIRV